MTCSTPGCRNGMSVHAECDACHQPRCAACLTDVAGDWLCPICKRGLERHGALVLAEAMEEPNVRKGVKL